MRHQIVWIYIGIVMLCSTVGQFFISAMVSHFGSLPLVITTTLRKFFTVLFSVFVLNNSLSIRQWAATGIIFGGLLLDALFGKKELCKKVEEEGEEETVDLKDKNSMRLKNKVGVEPSV
jgi:UDP-galactose transporter B1